MLHGDSHLWQFLLYHDKRLSNSKNSKSDWEWVSSLLVVLPTLLCLKNSDRQHKPKKPLEKVKTSIKSEGTKT